MGARHGHAAGRPIADISQDRPEVTLYRRADGWREQVVTEGEVPIDCLDVRVPVQAIYEEVPGVGTSG